MADLYNLLGELEEQEEEEHGIDDADDNANTFKENDPRRETVETLAMSEFNDGDDDGEPFETPTTVSMGRFVRTPRNNNNNNDDDNNDNPSDRDAEAAAFFKDLEGGGGGPSMMMMYGGDDDDVKGERQNKDQEEMVVPNELYAKLHQQWRQERHCPALLPFDQDMVAAFLQDFEENQEKLDDLMTSSHADELLIGNILQQDLDRAKFVLSDWLTQRLNKMEQHPLHHLQENSEHMSEHEKEHLEAYTEAMKKLLYGTVLNNLQEAWQTLDKPNMIDKPDYEGYHFWLVKDEIVDKDGQEHQTGVCLVAKYLDMKDHMTKNKVELLI